MYAVSAIIEQWDGSGWTVAKMPGARGQLAGGVAFGDDDVWAVGHTGLDSLEYRPLVMHWDGAGWTRVKSPRVERAYLLAVGGVATDDLWAVGTLIGSGETIVMHWNGRRWSLVDHPQPPSDYEVLGGVAARGSDDVIAVGSYLVDGIMQPLALHWNGSEWTLTEPVRIGDLGTLLNDVTVTKAGDVWAVGERKTSGGGQQPVAQHWTGTRWMERSPADLDGGGTLASIAAGPSGLWAVGARTPPGSAMRTLTEQWRPAKHLWKAVHSPSAGDDTRLLGIGQAPEGQMWAVGFHVAGPQQRAFAIQRC
jgi:hypothetical protein